MKKFIHILHAVLVWIWQGTKIVWYWIERILLVALLVTITVGIAWWTSQKPSLHRDWDPIDAVLPSITWNSETSVTIKNIRNHLWTTDKDFTARYYEETFDISKISWVHYVITPFSDSDGPAHTMLTFTFEDGKHLAISWEIRKERWESFDAIGGILNQYELIYVIANEEDVIKLRTNYRKNQVYMYPINTPKEKIQALFRSMLIRADKLAKEPEFYNTIWNNCTTSLLTHANALRENKLVWGKHVILPAHSDELIYGVGLINTQLPLPEARTYYRIDEIARNAWEEKSFSEIIRKEIQ